MATAAAIVAVALFVLLGYTFLHEGGHALFGLLFGGQITRFSVRFWDLSAHVGIQGEFSSLQSGIISLAGVGLPLAVWGLYVVLVPSSRNATLELARVAGSLGVLNSLLAWIIIPVLYLNGQAPGDDVTNFLDRTGAPPLLLSILAGAAYLAGWALLLSGRGGLRQSVRRLRSGEVDMLAPNSVRALRYVVVATVAIAAIAAGLTLYSTGANPGEAPPGYVQVAYVDLSQRALTNETVYTLALEEPGEVRFYFVLENTHEPVELALSGPDGSRSTFLKLGEDGVIGRATVHPDPLELERGEYRVEATLPRTDGSLSVFVKTVPRAATQPAGAATPTS